MHSKRADGSRFAVIDMIGTLRDGRIEAAGAFRNGRHTTLSWRKDMTAQSRPQARPSAWRVVCD